MTTALSGRLLLDPAVIQDPAPLYRRLHAEAPVWDIDGSGLFAVSSYALLAEATSRVEDFSSNITCLLYRDDAGAPQRLDYGDAGVQALATADPPVHALHRSTVFPELVARRMTELEPEIEALARACIDEATTRDSTDFMGVIGNIVPMTIISRLIGFQGSDLDQLMHAAWDSTAMLGSTLSYDELLQRIARTSEIQEWITGQVRLAVTDPGPDLLGAVARGFGDGVFGEFEAVVILHTLLSAGGESTSSLLGNAVRILAEQPALQAHLREHHEAIPAFIEEALRVESPFRYLMRSALRDTTLGGVAIPGGSVLLLLWGAANRDPDEFENPEQIDLERTTPRRHVAFGRGMHYCVGAPLARLEARIVLEQLLDATAEITLAAERPARWVNSLQVRRHEELPVRLVAG